MAAETLVETVNVESKDKDVVVSTDKEEILKEEEAKAKEDAKAKEVAKDEASATTAAKPESPKGCKKVNFEKDVVYLYQFPRSPALVSITPYCLKVETWLRMAGIKYENVDHKMRYRSKKGQLPFIELNGEEICDSSTIIEELGNKFGHQLDAHLSSEQKTLSHATVCMIENHLLWVIMWWKSKYPDSVLKGYRLNLQQALASRLPAVVLNAMFKYTYGRKALKKVKAHGIGTHSVEEIEKQGKDDMKVLSDILGEKKFFFGDEPSLLDIVAFSNLAQLFFLDAEVECPLREYLKETFPNLVALIERIKEKYYPDWEELCKPVEPEPKPVAEAETPKEEEKKAETECAPENTKTEETEKKDKEEIKTETVADAAETEEKKE